MTTTTTVDGDGGETARSPEVAVAPQLLTAPPTRTRLEVLARLRACQQRQVLRRTVRLLTAAPSAGNQGQSLLLTAHQLAIESRLDPALVLVTVLRESQFYHGTRWRSFWTQLFLLTTRVPVDRLRNKSLGLLSIKPALLARLADEQHLDKHVRLQLPRLVCVDDRFAIRIACRELARLQARGASDVIAFLAYAAKPETQDVLLDDPCVILLKSPEFRDRLRYYVGQKRLVATLLETCQRSWLGAQP